MASKKIENNIDGGLWMYYGHVDDDYQASAGVNWYDDGSGITYYISYHHGRLPAFNTETVGTLAELEAKMRAVQPDLRKWHTTYD